MPATTRSPSRSRSHVAADGCDGAHPFVSADGRVVGPVRRVAVDVRAADAAQGDRRHGRARLRFRLGHLDELEALSPGDQAGLHGRGPEAPPSRRRTASRPAVSRPAARSAAGMVAAATPSASALRPPGPRVPAPRPVRPQRRAHRRPGSPPGARTGGGSTNPSRGSRCAAWPPRRSARRPRGTAPRARRPGPCWTRGTTRRRPRPRAARRPASPRPDPASPTTAAARRRACPAG